MTTLFIGLRVLIAGAIFLAGFYLGRWTHGEAMAAFVTWIYMASGLAQILLVWRHHRREQRKLDGQLRDAARKWERFEPFQ